MNGFKKNQYIYIYIYHIEGAVFTTIWCSMYKVQSVDSRNAEKEKTDSLLLCFSYSLSDECLRTKLRVTENRSFPFLHFC